MSSSLRAFSIMAKHEQAHSDDEWNLKYRTYLLLASQQSQIRHRLSLSSSTPSYTHHSSSFSSHATLPSLSPSPTDSILLPSRPNTYYTFNGPLSPVATDPLPSFASQPSRSDEDRLLDINRQIKATLTDLLNHPGVRQDAGFSSWVKECLMDTAHERRELRKMRCERRTSPSAFAVSGSEDEMDGLRD